MVLLQAFNSQIYRIFFVHTIEIICISYTFTDKTAISLHENCIIAYEGVCQEATTIQDKSKCYNLLRWDTLSAGKVVLKSDELYFPVILFGWKVFSSTCEN